MDAVVVCADPLGAFPDPVGRRATWNGVIP